MNALRTLCVAFDPFVGHLKAVVFGQWDSLVAVRNKSVRKIVRKPKRRQSSCKRVSSWLAKFLAISTVITPGRSCTAYAPRADVVDSAIAGHQPLLQLMLRLLSEASC